MISQERLQSHATAADTLITLLVLADCEIQCVISAIRKGILQKFVNLDERTVINSKHSRNNLDRVTQLLANKTHEEELDKHSQLGSQSLRMKSLV